MAAHLADLRECYEHVRHARLWEEGKVFDYPLALLRVSLRAYRWWVRRALSRARRAAAGSPAAVAGRRSKRQTSVVVT